jgi:prepilin signal peptidase PulO-like enzyme (type II secretory pathway)
MEIPFGPFLVAGALLYIFGGPDFIAWYLSRPSLF